MADADREPRSRYLIGMAAAAAISGVVVAGGAWALGVFALWQAAVGSAVALGVGLIVALPWSRDIVELAARARSIGVDEPDPQPMARRTVLGAEIGSALIESRRRVNRVHRALEERAVTGERVLDAAPEPLIVLDIRQQITHANHAAEQAFGGQLSGRPVVEVARSPELLDAVEAVLSGLESQATVDIDINDFGLRSYRAIIGRLERVGGAGEAAVVAMQDLTAIRRVEEMRADFVANASHELRTPLASLVGFIETLDGPARDDVAARQRFLGIMRDQAAHMARLVEDLLSLSRIEMEEHAPPGVTNDLVDVLQAVVDQLSPVAAERDVTVVFDAPEFLPEVAGDPDILQQVFRNLIENAIKYGRKSGKVEIVAGVVDGEVRVAISDEGPGIPAEHIPRLTERFYRVDVARSRTMGGTGLGLAIVKHILNRCGARLVVSSRVEVGSVFTVFLPPAP